MSQSCSDELIGIIIDQHRSDDEPLDHYGQRVYNELVQHRELLVRMLGIPRPGPCGHQPPIPWSDDAGQPTVYCTLDAGHAGCHKDGQQGTVWREVS